MSGCNEVPNPISYYIDEANNLVVQYEDDSTTILGEYTEDIIKSFNSVTISEDYFYIINGIKTNIPTKVLLSYSIDNDKHLIGTYSDDSTCDLGLFDEAITYSIKEVSISTDYYYILDGVKTEISAETDIVEIVDNISVSEDGYYIINGTRKNLVATNLYTVSFDTNYSTILSNQIIFEGHKVEKPTLDRIGYTFNGWFCNGEEWRFNSDVVLNDMSLTAQWKWKEWN